MNSFKKRDLSNQTVIALTDGSNYKPFKIEEEKKRVLEERDSGTFVPKGNPYHVSKNSEVILIKDRKDAEFKKRVSSLTKKAGGNMDQTS